jgi:glyoxylase-like metal-dependent hydrolase (beta-lactamase superfamily II)
VRRPRIVRVLAPNPGPFTLEGTNTWIVGEAPALVIDPGPDDASHIERVRREAGPVAAILLTHQHPDHAPGAARLAELAGAPVLSFRPEGRERALCDGAELAGGGVVLRAVATPGHTPDHVAFFEPDGRSLFTGDAVVGRGTSIIDPPDGDVRVYLASLGAMLVLEPRVIYPGHGPAVWDARAKLHEYRRHRGERERQVLEGLAGGPKTPMELVPGIYGGYPPEIHPAAARSVLAHLLKLEADGRVQRVGDDSEDRFERMATTPRGRKKEVPAEPGGKHPYGAPAGAAESGAERARDSERGGPGGAARM